MNCVLLVVMMDLSLRGCGMLMLVVLVNMLVAAMAQILLLSISHSLAKSSAQTTLAKANLRKSLNSNLSNELLR